MKNSNKQNKRRRGSRAQGTGANPSGGDIPVRPRRTYETVSARFPRASDSVIVHTNAAAVVTASNAAAVTNTYYFSMTGSGGTTGNFDQYKLHAVRFSIIPSNNALGLYTNSTTGLVDLYCVIDYDDATALGSSAAAQGYNNCITMGPGESCSRVFQPRMALAAYSGTFTSYANVEPQWIDAASPGVQHYGIKLFVPQAIAAQTQLQSWTVTVEYAWELRANLA